MAFTSAGNLHWALDGAGNRTSYSWDTNSRLLGIGDGKGNRTSFTYATLPNKLGSLSSVRQALGTIFTYTYSVGEALVPTIQAAAA
jgi:YD repeat-containing protein